jgi:phenylacetate-CoA ligase
MTVPSAILHRVLIGLAVPDRLKALAMVEQRKGWGPAQIRAFQEEKLRQTIDYCWANVPFYREHWASAISGPEAIRGIADLVRLPLLSKTHVREQMAGLCSREQGLASSEARTGGSTGSPVIFRMTPHDEQLQWAQMYIGWQWAGWRVGDPFLIVGGESVGIGLADKRSRKDWVMNRWVSSGSNLTLERTRALAAAPHFHRIRLIYGYPNSIRELGEFLQQLGVRPRALRGIVCTAEVMRPEVRERIAQLYGVDHVLDQWGLNDGGMHACEGPEQDGLHLSFHRGILEILDEQGAQINTPAIAGRAIVTTIANPAMPFIRYDCGDRVHWQSEVPAASCAWPRIGPVDGRAGDVIHLPSGRSIPMPGLTLVMRWLQGLRSYQFIQTGPDAVTVRLVLETGVTMADDAVAAFLAERISRDVAWTVQWAAPELTRNGKLLIIKNDWLRSQGLDRPQAPPALPAHP